MKYNCQNLILRCISFILILIIFGIGYFVGEIICLRYMGTMNPIKGITKEKADDLFMGLFFACLTAEIIFERIKDYFDQLEMNLRKNEGKITISNIKPKYSKVLFKYQYIKYILRCIECSCLGIQMGLIDYRFFHK